LRRLRQGYLRIQEPKLNAIAETLDNVLANCNLERGYKPDIARQRKIFENLPDNYIEHIYELLEAKYESRRRYIKNLSRYDSEFVQTAFTTCAGLIFESLVSYDENINPLAKNTRGSELSTEEKEEIHRDWELSQELLHLVNDPKAFKLEYDIECGRNPDLAIIEVDVDNNIVIKGFGEATLGEISTRKLDQLSEHGFIETFEYVADYLNSAKNLRASGLNHLADFRESLANRKGDFIAIDKKNLK
jgi:hypothetical protein